MRVALQENVWSFLPGGKKKVQTDKPQRTTKKVAVITRWPYYRGGRKAGFLCIFNNPIFYLVLIGLTRCSGQEGELTRFLLNTTHYNNKFRPVKDDNSTVNVEHSLILHRIVKVVSCFEIQYVLLLCLMASKATSLNLMQSHWNNRLGLRDTRNLSWGNNISRFCRQTHNAG